MNYRMMGSIIGKVLLGEAALMLLPLITAVLFREAILPFIIAIAIAAAVGGATMLLKPKSENIYAREGFVAVGLSWIVLSLVGAIPFVVSGEIPNYYNALFETVSGFTTTGATQLTNYDLMPKSLMLWRVFTQWIGGMGVMIFILAVVPMAGGRNMHIMRAEVPGPVVGKLAPRARKSAKILYRIYIVLTVLEVVFLLFGGMNFYDALIHSFATAGTGGFSNHLNSIGYYDSTYIDIVVAVFMMLFGINFQIFFLVIARKVKDVLRSDELRIYLAIILFATVTIAINLLSIFGNFFEALRYSFFQTTSMISTTAFATANYDLWPQYSRWLLLILMLIGGCAGSTAGGLKISRVIILVRSIICEMKKLISPKKVNRVWLEGKKVEDTTIREVNTYFILYILIIAASTMILATEGKDMITNITASVACITNIGPGFGSLIGPVGNYGSFNWLSKLVLMLDMLIGRLEIYPVIFMCTPAVWKKRYF